MPENAVVAKLTAITLPEQNIHEFELALDDDFDIDDLPGIDNLIDVHKSRRREITIATDLDDVERRVRDDNTLAGADDAGFPDAFGQTETPEAQRVDVAAAEFQADDMAPFAADANEIADNNFDNNDFGGAGFDDGAGAAELQATPMEPAIVSSKKHTAAAARRASRLLTSALGQEGMELLALQPDDFAAAGAANMPDSAGGAAAALKTLTPAHEFVVAGDESAARRPAAAGRGAALG